MGDAPAFTDPTNQGIHSGSAVFAVMFLNVLVACILVPTWWICMRKNTIYEITATTRVDIWGWGKRNGQSCKGWLLGSTAFESIARTDGADTALYLLFMKVQTLIATWMLFSSCLVFTPLHLLSPSPEDEDIYMAKTNHTFYEEEDQFFIKTTVHGIEQTPGILLFHVVGVTLNALVAYYLINEFATQARRVICHTKLADMQDSRRSIKIKGLSDNHSVADIQNSFELTYPDSVEAVYLAYDVRGRITLQEKLAKTLLMIKYLTCKISSCAADDIPVNPKLRVRLEHLANKKQKYIESIEDWTSEERSSKKPLDFAHVVFSSRAIQQLILTRNDFNLLSGATVSLKAAHHPLDINWKEVGKSKGARVVLVNFILGCGLFFFSTPTAIFTTFQRATRDVKGIRRLFSSLSDVSNSSFGSLLFQYLPVLTYLILSLTLPLLVEWVTKRQPQISRFKARQLVLTRVFTYMVLCTYILPSIALSTVSALLSELGSPNSTSGSVPGDVTPVDSEPSSGSLDALHHAVEHLFMANSGAFFVNLLQVYATVGNFYELWRPIELIHRFRAIYFPKVDKRDSWSWVDDFEFSWQYPLVLSSFAICFNYAVFAPLSSIFYFIFIVAKITIHSNHSRANLFSRSDTLDNTQAGQLLRTVVVLSLWCIVVALAFSIAFFIFRREALQFVPHSLFLFAVLLYITHKTFKAMSKSCDEYAGSTTTSLTSDFERMVEGSNTDAIALFHMESSVSGSPKVIPVTHHLYATPYMSGPSNDAPDSGTNEPTGNLLQIQSDEAESSELEFV